MDPDIIWRCHGNKAEIKYVTQNYAKEDQEVEMIDSTEEKYFDNNLSKQDAERSKCFRKPC